MDVKLNNAMQAYARGAKVAVEAASGAPAAGEGSSFADLVRQTMTDATQAGRASEAEALKATVGKADVTDLVTAVSKAEVALETVVAVRDRVISAYQEIMRMPI